MTDRVRWLVDFHQKKCFGTAANLRSQQIQACQLYKSLGDEETASLAELALSDVERRDMLLCLACFRPGSLRSFHETLVDHRIFYPGVIYHGAASTVTRRLLDAITPSVGRRLLDAFGAADQNTLRLNHILLALAWIGDETVQNAFADWRRNPPAWSSKLHVKLHDYAVEAGWELTDEGSRRELFDRNALPLVKPDNPRAIPGAATVAGDAPGVCGWCGQPLTAILDFDLTTTALVHMSLPGKRLRIATCHVCTCYGSVFTEVDLKGATAWSRANVKPGFLPKDLSSERFPSGRLVLSSETRHFLESASWFLPGVSSSQIGGCPTWIQDAQYPECPHCSHRMPCLGQVAVADIEEYGEGIYYAFFCRGCGMAATTYQQS
jgi:hypothetical protein